MYELTAIISATMYDPISDEVGVYLLVPVLDVDEGVPVVVTFILSSFNNVPPGLVVVDLHHLIYEEVASTEL